MSGLATGLTIIRAFYLLWYDETAYTLLCGGDLVAVRGSTTGPENETAKVRYGRKARCAIADADAMMAMRVPPRGGRCLYATPRRLSKDRRNERGESDEEGGARVFRGTKSSIQKKKKNTVGNTSDLDNPQRK